MLGVSVTLIRQGQIAWTRGWGVRDAGMCALFTPETIFQAASISKRVTALLAHRLVEQGIGCVRMCEDVRGVITCDGL